MDKVKVFYESTYDENSEGERFPFLRVYRVEGDERYSPHDHPLIQWWDNEVDGEELILAQAKELGIGEVELVHEDLIY